MYLSFFQHPWVKAAGFAALISALVWCFSARDNTPEYLRQPFTPFSRSEAVAVALREWQMWGNDVYGEVPAGGKKERMPAYWQRVGDYFWQGVAPDTPSFATGKHKSDGTIFDASANDTFSWSGAFISYLMREAGAASRFPYASDASYFINAARLVSLGRRNNIAIHAEDPSYFEPRVGDLICTPDNGKKTIKFQNLPMLYEFSAHCDFVVEKQADMLLAIGGDVQDSVSMKQVTLNAKGLLLKDQKSAPSDYRWFVILGVEYDHD